MEENPLELGVLLHYTGKKLFHAVLLKDSGWIGDPWMSSSRMRPINYTFFNESVKSRSMKAILSSFYRTF